MRATLAESKSTLFPVPCPISVLTTVVQQPKGRSWQPEARSMSWFICLSVWTLTSVCCSCALCWSPNTISVCFPPSHQGDLAFQSNEYSEHFSGEPVGSSFKSSTLKWRSCWWVERSKLSTGNSGCNQTAETSSVFLPCVAERLEPLSQNFGMSREDAKGPCQASLSQSISLQPLLVTWGHTA